MEATQQILDTFCTDLTIKKVRTKAINDYGQSIRTYIDLSIQDSQCQICREWALTTNLQDQVFPKLRQCHRWKFSWRLIASVVAITEAEAMDKLEVKVKEFVARIAHASVASIR